jgi:hypothetical protein
MTVGLQYGGSGLSQRWLCAFGAGQHPGKSGNYEELPRLAAALALDSISAAVTRRRVLTALLGGSSPRVNRRPFRVVFFRHFVAHERHPKRVEAAVPVRMGLQSVPIQDTFDKDALLRRPYVCIGLRSEASRRRLCGDIGVAAISVKGARLCVCRASTLSSFLPSHLPS